MPPHLPIRPALGLRFRLPPKFLLPSLTRLQARQISSAHNPSLPSLDFDNFQKTLKATQKQKNKSSSPPTNGNAPTQRSFLPHGWLLTVGLEFHAQLTAPTKLFSPTLTSHLSEANTHVLPIDVSIPGTHPILSPTALVPAIQAALILNCKVNTESLWDRKHYFYWDQPAGYQITQYYKPLALNGLLPLREAEDLGMEGLGNWDVQIERVQIEQDTAKTVLGADMDGAEVNLVDFNRVGHPLVEIITTPCITSPAMAGAVMRKIQSVLKVMGVATLGMEWGGLRADVNVSVRREGEEKLGQRCEIKNLSSVKAVIEAIEAEARRQVEVVKSGGVVVGETRGWDGEKGETHKLRGKEGEVDYRYMPDPDIPPLRLDQGLIDEIKNNLPWSPSQHLNHLVKDMGLTTKDAKTLIYYEGGDLMAYYYQVKESAYAHMVKVERDHKHAFDGFKEYARVAGNWVIHNLLGTLTKEKLTFEENPVPADKLGKLVQLVLDKMLSNGNAKKLLERLIFQPKPTDAETCLEKIANDEGLIVTPATEKEVKAVIEELFYDEKDVNAVKARVEIKMLAEKASEEGVDEATKTKSEKRRAGLENMFLGKAMKKLGSKGQPDKVSRVLKEVIKAELAEKSS